MPEEQNIETTASEKKEDKIDKQVPSPLEHLMYKFLYKFVGPHIPEKMTPNQITLIGAISSLIGIIFSFLSRLSVWFLIGTILCIMGHLVCDDLDGYVARKRNMTSRAGAYFDLLTDILHITFLIIGMAYSGIVKYQIAVWMVPVYALIIFTSMNSILYLKEFPFPRLGPIETHLFFQAICLITIIFGTQDRVFIWNLHFNITDLVFIVGMIPMYIEMIRLQISLFVKLSKQEKTKG